MPRIAPWLLALLLSGAAAAPTQADEGRERSARVPVPRNNGPRWVPTPRGASARRAEALGLGTRAAANRLMHGHPDPRWVAAAAQAGPMPAHLRWPVELGRFGRGFGFVRRTRPELRHDGVDIVAAEGSTLRAVAPGLVAYADNGVRGFGNAVMIVHPNGWVSVYAHCHRVTVPAGYRVRAGERIGFVGSTGISRGPHLHLELRTDGRAFDPLPSFEGRPWIAAYRAWRARRAAGEAEVSGQHLEDRLPPQRPAPAPATPAPAAALGRIGARALTLRLLRRGPTAAEAAEAPGDRFPTLLWPLRGPAQLAARPRGVNLHAAPGTPVRATADGLVVHAGPGLPGVGRAVVLLHPDGKVTLYGACGDLHVEVGQSVRRGEWIARVGPSDAPHLHFQLRQSGEAPDVVPHFVQVPASRPEEAHDAAANERRAEHPG